MSLLVLHNTKILSGEDYVTDLHTFKLLTIEHYTIDAFF